MYIKLFAAGGIQYSELRIFSFNSHVYNLTRGFIAPTRAFNLQARAFNLATRAFSVLTRGFELVTLNSCFTFTQINHGAIQKVCHLHNGIFHSIHLCHIVNFTLSLPLCYSFTKNKII